MSEGLLLRKCFPSFAMSGRVTVEETSKLFNMESQLKARGVAFLFTMASFALVGSSVDQEEECDANGKCPLAWSFTNYGTAYGFL